MYEGTGYFNSLTNTYCRDILASALGLPIAAAEGVTLPRVLKPNEASRTIHSCSSTSNRFPRPLTLHTTQHWIICRWGDCVMLLGTRLPRLDLVAVIMQVSYSYCIVSNTSSSPHARKYRRAGIIGAALGLQATEGDVIISIGTSGTGRGLFVDSKSPFI
jgi:hypothetical protein